MAATENSETNYHSEGLGIAIIGMAGRFPGARNIDQFWQNLCGGVESISFFTDGELKASGVDPAEFNAPNYVRAAPTLEDIELFDAAFFGYTPIEARVMDPQQRILLECAWEALEHAGYDPEKYDDPIGVYAGARMSSYITSLYTQRELADPQNMLLVLLGNDISSLSTRLSYKLNLKGPSYALQTACSTSLVAVHLACQSLLLGECRMALAGAVAVTVPHKVGYLYQPGSMLSPDGHCRVFDAKAQGTLFGSGVGMVVLKRLDDALADGDCIHAVIRGSATNNDGSLKASFTAPSVEGQTDVIIDALACAGVEADSISYVEAHGTGTPLGDPIEILALTHAFRASTEKKGFCRIGSVKANLGHLDAAAGMAGLIKTVLSLKHGLIPPSLHLERPNPQIDFAHSPFYVNTRLSEWRSDGLQRRAGVSSFGFGGTNAHIILEQAPPVEPSSESRPWQLLILSARTGSALDAVTANLAVHLKQHPDVNLADVAFTLQRGRREFSHRRMIVCCTAEDAARALETIDPQSVLTDVQESGERPIVFMFPGQGAQYVNMGLELYQAEPTFREQIDRCSELLKPHLGLDLRSVLYPDPSDAEEAARQLEQTIIAQPALFVIEYALAQLWMNWGIRPQAMIGHSIGEYVAACLASVFTLQDALRLVSARGRLMQQLPVGAMLSVSLPEQEVQPLLDSRLSLAASNGPALCVVSGPTDAVDVLQGRLIEQEIACRRLHTSHAFHSAMMAPILEPFAQEVKGVTLKPPQMAYISNVTGGWITPEEATDPNYWARHLRQTVRFAQGMRELFQQPQRILLEVGPGQSLCTFARQEQEPAPGLAALASMRHPHHQQSDVAFLLNALGRLWLAGTPVNWAEFYAHEQRRRAPLPTYPFERARYWVDPPKQGNLFQTLQDWTRKKQEIADWFYIPIWKQSMPPALPAPGAWESGSCWLVLSDDCGLGTRLAMRLEGEGQQVFTITTGQKFAWLGDRACVINPQRRDDYVALVRDLRAGGKTPKTIVHLWSVFSGEPDQGEGRLFDKCQDLGFYSLIYLAQALGEQNVTEAIQIAVVSNHLHKVESGDVSYPEKATVLGPCKVIPHEYPHITCRSIDLVLPPAGTRQEETLVDQLLAEVTTPSPDRMMAYRGPHRWVQAFDAIRLDASPERATRLRQGGRYLITGGLGGIGLVLAEYLAQSVQARLALVGRSTPPPREEWEHWLATHDDQDEVSSKIRKLQGLEARGAQVMVASADVTSLEQMQAMVTRVYERWGGIDGIIHAAGVAGGGMIQLKTPEMAVKVLAPKVKGALVLDTLFKESHLDFWVLFSSISAIVGELGQVDYCAANAFLNAFACQHSARDGTFTVAIDWDMWREVGMAANMQVPPALRAWREEQLKLAILPEEGMEAFRHILSASTFPQVVVSTTDLQAVIKQVNAFTEAHILEEAEKLATSAAAQPRPKLQTPYVPPGDETEQILVDLWQRILGVTPVGIHDNFFELGGHSLLATQLVNQVYKTFKVEIPIQSLFENTTVAGLASLIRGSNPPAEEEKPIAERLQVAFPTERQGLLEEYLRRKVAYALNLKVEQLPANGDLADWNLESIAVDLMMSLKQDLQIQVFPHEIPEMPSIQAMAGFVMAELDRKSDLKKLATTEPLTAYTLKPYRKQVAQRRAPAALACKNKSMVFLHSSPRAGSTLLRIMLAGHPDLFCPPELNLLFFDDMREWRQNIGFGHDFQWTAQGLHWAFVELMGISTEEGWALLDDLVTRDRTVHSVYGQLQELAGERLLVDKTPTYALDLETLERAEALFEAPKYIFLFRHPYAVIESLLNVRLDRLFGPSLFEEKDVDPYVVAEMAWTLSNRNLLRFFDQIGPERYHPLRYEELVRDPAGAMADLCRFLDIPFDPVLLNPYDGRRERMMGGLGDPNIFQHEGIDASLGEAWKRVKLPRRLDASTKQLATRLGYDLPAPVEPTVPTSLPLPSPGQTEEQLLESLAQLSDERVHALLQQVLAEEMGE